MVSSREKDMASEKRSLSNKQRYDLIFQTLQTRRTMKIAEIQDLLGVSGMTVRRCLDDMQREGILRRVHGGAAIVDPWNRISAFHQRLSQNTRLKTEIALKAMELVPDQGSIFIDGGSTCYEMTKLMRHSDKKCGIVTDGVAAAMELRDRKISHTILIGGQVGEDANSMDGPLAVDMASRVSVSTAFFSSTTFDDERVEMSTLVGFMVKKVMLQKANKVVCLIDSTKYRQLMGFHFYSWEDIDILITDSGLPESAREAIAARGVEIHIAN